jgi:hypothetical protein
MKEEKGITIHYDTHKTKTPCGLRSRDVWVTGSAGNVSCQKCKRWLWQH